jgi:hypothetical protein
MLGVCYGLGPDLLAFLVEKFIPFIWVRNW